jgi:hypothetical protein
MSQDYNRHPDVAVAALEVRQAYAALEAHRNRLPSFGWLPGIGPSLGKRHARIEANLREDFEFKKQRYIDIRARLFPAARAIKNQAASGVLTGPGALFGRFHEDRRRAVEPKNQKEAPRQIERAALVPTDTRRVGSAAPAYRPGINKAFAHLSQKVKTAPDHIPSQMLPRPDYFDLTPTDHMGYDGPYHPRTRRLEDIAALPGTAGGFEGKIYLHAPAEIGKTLAKHGVAVGALGGVYIERDNPNLFHPDVQKYAPFFARQHYVPLRMHMLPPRTWATSPQRIFTTKSWLAYSVSRREGTQKLCQICGQTASSTHPVWRYLMPVHGNVGIRLLKAMLVACDRCSPMFTLGRAGENGKGDEVTYRLSLLNGWDEKEAEEGFEIISHAYNVRSELYWASDLSMLEGNRFIIEGRWAPDGRGGLERPGHPDRFEDPIVRALISGITATHAKIGEIVFPSIDELYKRIPVQDRT